MRIHRFFCAFAAAIFCLCAQAHVGSPNVVIEGKAGPYPLRVFVRPPTVVPGVAEITVRVLEGGAESVTVLPVYWQTGHAGAPTPDKAKPVPGETNLFSGGLWLMKSGAYSIDVHASGAQGEGTLVVPVNSIATNTKPMSKAYGIMLACLGLLLVANIVKIIGIIFGESLAGPEGLGARSRRNGRIAMVVATLAISSALYGGKKWWDSEERDYRDHRVYRPVLLEATVQSRGDWPFLKLKLDGKTRRSDSSPLLPDHGKIMHLFAVRKGGLDAFAHIHPVSAGNRAYETPIPPLPAGEYELYADVTHENGFAETWTATAVFPAASKIDSTPPRNPADAVCAMPLTLGGKTLPFDADDSWHTGKPQSRESGTPSFSLPGGRKMAWVNSKPLHPDEEAVLQFQLLGPNGQPAPIVSYMGMAGHAALRRDDGSVFAHLHPAGTISMASQTYFLKKDAPRLQSLSGDQPSNSVPNETFIDHTTHTNTSTEPGIPQIVTFPYSFPKTGTYRIWVQMKSGEQIFTGVFDAVVEAGKSGPPAS